MAVRLVVRFAGVRWTPLLLVVLLAVGLAGQAGPRPAHGQVSTPGAGSSLTIEGAWARAGFAGGSSAIYLTIRNVGQQPDALIAVQSPAAAAAELHRSFVEGGVARMEPVARLEIPAGGQVKLEPGGLHVMLIGLHGDLVEGTEISLTARFERAGALRLAVPVRPLAMSSAAGQGGLVRPVGPDASGQVRLTLAAEGITAHLTLHPMPLSESVYEVSLEARDGVPVAGVSRVAFKLAMIGMNHGVYNQEAALLSDGRYRAQGNDLIMAGGWYGWLVVELGGATQALAFRFDTGPAPASVVASAARSTAPAGIRLVDVVVYPGELHPTWIDLVAGEPTLIEAVLADGATCGTGLSAPAWGLRSAFAPSGFAQLRLTPGESRGLTVTCTSAGMLLD